MRPRRPSRSSALSSAMTTRRFARHPLVPRLRDRRVHERQLEPRDRAPSGVRPLVQLAAHGLDPVPHQLERRLGWPRRGRRLDLHRAVVAAQADRRGLRRRRPVQTARRRRRMQRPQRARGSRQPLRRDRGASPGGRRGPPTPPRRLRSGERRGEDAARDVPQGVQRLLHQLPARRGVGSPAPGVGGARTGTVGDYAATSVVTFAALPGAIQRRRGPSQRSLHALGHRCREPAALDVRGVEQPLP